MVTWRMARSSEGKQQRQSNHDEFDERPRRLEHAFVDQISWVDSKTGRELDEGSSRRRQQSQGAF